MLKLKELYKKEIVSQMKEKFSLKNELRIPRFVKVVVHAGIGKSREDAKLLETAEATIKTITGQKPKATLAKKAISGFKVRRGDKVGLMVTLRGSRMYDFLEKLSRIVLPRIRDFRGLNESAIDKQDNLNIGIKEQIAFPEIKPEKIEKAHGLEINIVTNAQNHNEAKELFQLAGFKFKEK